MTVEQGIEFISGLILPDGRTLADAFPADPWLVDDVLVPILSVDDDGLPLYKLVYIELPRGHAKTSCCAWVSLWDALDEGNTEIVGTAADLDQSRLLHDAISGQLNRNPRLADAVKRTINGFRVIWPEPNGSRIRLMSSDAATSLGIGSDCRRLRIVCDELTAWGERDFFDSLLTALPKVRDSQMIIISNAGLDPGVSWQWQVRQQAAEQGYLFTTNGVLASWIRPQDLALIRRTTPDSVFNRFYFNIWADSVSEFVPIEQWDALAGVLPPIPADWPCVVGVDAAITGDDFAIVTVARDPNRIKNAVMVLEVVIFEPPKHGSIDFDEARAYLIDLCARRKVVQFAYDDWQLHDFMTRFQQEHRVWCEPFSQGAPRNIADSDLFLLIRDGRIIHDGNPQLREHIRATAMKTQVREDSKARLVKKGNAKIDGAVALSMAAYQCLYLRLDSPSASILNFPDPNPIPISSL